MSAEHAAKYFQQVGGPQQIDPMNPGGQSEGFYTTLVSSQNGQVALVQGCPMDEYGFPVGQVWQGLPEVKSTRGQQT